MLRIEKTLGLTCLATAVELSALSLSSLTLHRKKKKTVRQMNTLRFLVALFFQKHWTFFI